MNVPRPDLAPTRVVAQALNRCIEICVDGERGYAAAAADVRNPELKAHFFAKAKERSEFVVALQRSLANLGVTGENQGTPSGLLHRGWIAARRVLEGASDEVVIEEWVRGEEAAYTGYALVWNALPLSTLPDDVAAMVRAQQLAIRRGLDEARIRLAQLAVVQG